MRLPAAEHTVVPMFLVNDVNALCFQESARFVVLFVGHAERVMNEALIPDVGIDRRL